MFTHYLVLAVKVLLRRKFFTFISLFGISFTLLVLTVVVAMFDHAFGPGAEEPRQNRTLYADRAVMYGPHGAWSGNGGFKLYDRYARHLPGVERLSLYQNSHTVHPDLDARPAPPASKRRHHEACQIREFDFLEGGP